MIKESTLANATLAGLMAVSATACSSVEATNPEGVEVTFVAEESEPGVCEPHRIARVNKEETGLRALYGQVRYLDTSGGRATNLPFQLLFRGWDENGISDDTVRTGLNAETPCSNVEIVVSVNYCFLDETGNERTACPDISLSGEGFAGITLQEDNSRRYMEEAE